MLKLKLQYFGHLMRRADSFEKTWYWERLRAGGEGDDRGWNDWMASLTQWTWVWVESSSWWWTGRPSMLRFMGLQRVRHKWETELNWICRASLVAQMAKNLPAMQETQVNPWVRMIPWRREWQTTPVFLPREFHGQRSLVSYSPQGHKELDIEQLTLYFVILIKKTCSHVFWILELPDIRLLCL